MYYASIGIIALLIHFIINYDVLTCKTSNEIPAHKHYKRFLFSVMCFYIIDASWGIIYDLNIPLLCFIDTEIYFVIMAVSVFLWTRYVIAYLNEGNTFSRILHYSGWIFLIVEVSVLIVNLFLPIAFWFNSDGSYHTNSARDINLYIQIFMFLISTIHMLFVMFKTEGTVRNRHRAVGFFGFAITLFVWLQQLTPYLPFYSLGLMIGTCILHTFVIEDEKEEKRKEIEKLLIETREKEAELGTARHIAFTDPLTGIKNKSAYIEDIGILERRLADEGLDNFGIIVFDLNGLKMINDTKGHEAGDKYIKDASHLICNMFKHSPVYRIGGDEFVAFLEGEDFDHHNELLAIFDEQIEENLQNDRVVISFGFSKYNKKDDSIMRVFERADKKMYNCKKKLKDIQK